MPCASSELDIASRASSWIDGLSCNPKIINKDPEGEVLANLLAPLPGVCGGINLEYHFSRMVIEKTGAAPSYTTTLWDSSG